MSAAGWGTASPGSRLVHHPCVQGFGPVIGICFWGPRDDPGVGPAGSSAEACAGWPPHHLRRTPELARSVLHTERGCQEQKWGGTDLPWMCTRRTPVPSGADGLISHAMGGLPDDAARPVAERTASGTLRQADCGLRPDTTRGGSGSPRSSRCGCGGQSWPGEKGTTVPSSGDWGRRTCWTDYRA